MKPNIYVMDLYQKECHPVIYIYTLPVGLVTIEPTIICNVSSTFFRRGITLVWFNWI